MKSGGRSAVAALLLGASLGASSCSGSGSEDSSSDESARLVDGPLDFGATKGTTCLALQNAKDLTFGSDFVRSDAADIASARIGGVAIEGEENLVLVESSLMPLGESIVGSWSTFPPPARVLTGDSSQWAERVSAVGAELRPGVTYNLVLHLRVDDPRSESQVSSVRVDYEAAGRRYSEITPTALNVAIRC